MMLYGDIQEGEDSYYRRRVNKTTNSNYPWKDMHCPTLFCVVTECREKRVISFLLADRCCSHLVGVDIRWAIEVGNSYSLELM
jgi:hypothetical protein